MNLNHTIRLLLLMLFVLLQCVAPLAHAHVNGDNADQSMHFDDIDSLWSGDHHHESATTQFSAEEHHSAVVRMPPEYRSSAVVIAQPVLTSRHCMAMPGEFDLLVFDDFYQQTLSSSPYQHPFSQAPPV